MAGRQASADIVITGVPAYPAEGTDAGFLRELVARLGREVYRVPGLPAAGFDFVTRARRANPRSPASHLIVTLSAAHALGYVTHGRDHPALKVMRSTPRRHGPGKGKGKGKGAGRGRGLGRGFGRG